MFINLRVVCICMCVCVRARAFVCMKDRDRETLLHNFYAKKYSTSSEIIRQFCCSKVSFRLLSLGKIRVCLSVRRQAVFLAN